MSLQRRRPSRAVAGWQHGTNTSVLMAGAAYGAVMRQESLLVLSAACTRGAIL